MGFEKAHTPEIDSQRIGAKGGRRAPVRSFVSQSAHKESKSKLICMGLCKAHTPEIDSQRLGARGGRKVPVRSVNHSQGRKQAGAKYY